MTDFRALLETLRRPRMLIRAARCGVLDYRRERDLKRLVDSTPSPERAVTRLLAEEERLEDIRVSESMLTISVPRSPRAAIAPKLTP